jgi:hypothetical protein
VNEPHPVRVTEAVRVTRAAEVVETVRVVEYAGPTPAGRQELASGREGSQPARLNTRPDMSGMWLHGGVEDVATPALPAGAPAPPRPWWRWWR